jgi:hypothetical protein
MCCACGDASAYVFPQDGRAPVSGQRTHNANHPIAAATPTMKPGSGALMLSTGLDLRRTVYIAGDTRTARRRGGAGRG